MRPFGRIGRGHAKHATGKAKGAAHAVTPSAPRLEDADDVTLARKVETEIFRAPNAPKGDVSVDVQAPGTPAPEPEPRGMAQERGG